MPHRCRVSDVNSDFELHRVLIDMSDDITFSGRRYNILHCFSDAVRVRNSNHMFRLLVRSITNPNVFLSALWVRKDPRNARLNPTAGPQDHHRANRGSIRSNRRDECCRFSARVTETGTESNSYSRGTIRTDRRVSTNRPKQDTSTFTTMAARMSPSSIICSTLAKYASIWSGAAYARGSSSGTPMTL